MNDLKVFPLPDESYDGLVPQLKDLRGDKAKCVFLCDFSWMLHRCYHAYKKQNPVAHIDGEEIYTGELYGILRSVNMMASRRPDAAIVLCLDVQNPNTAKHSDEYKQGRGDVTPVYSKMYDIIAACSILPNVYISIHPGIEADEVIFHWSQILAETLPYVYIHANDRDIYQSLTADNIQMFQKVDGRGFSSFGGEIIQEKFKVDVPANKLAFFRAIAGDSSDNLKGYPRFPRALLQEIVTTFDDPKHFLRSDFWHHKSSYQRHVDIVRNDPATLLTNYKIMRLKPVDGCKIFQATGDWSVFDKFQLRTPLADFKRLMSYTQA